VRSRAPDAGRFDNQAEGGGRYRAWSQVRLYLRIVGVELPRDGMEVVTAFGNGEGDNARRRIGHLLDGSLGIVRRVEVFDDRPNHLGCPLTLGILQH